jgi:hypothetical protein
MPTMRSDWRRLFLACLAVVSGCSAGTPGPLGAQQSGMPARQVQADAQAPIQDPLNLTQQQQQSLVQAFQALAPDNSLQTRVKALQDLLLAENVDLAALTASLTSSRQSLIENVDKVIAAFRSLRETLDVNQRNTLLALIQEQANQMAKPTLPDEFKLSKEQQEALTSLQPERGPISQALSNYLQSGNDDALRQVITADIAAMPTPDVVASALAGLSKEQRQKMFAMEPADSQQGATAQP